MTERNGNGRPSIREIRAWLRSEGDFESDQAVLKLAEHLEQAGLGLSDLELVVTGDRAYPNRIGRSEKEQRALYLCARKVPSPSGGGRESTRCYFAVER